MNNIKIAVIGGTGKSGKFLVEQLLNQGFHLKLLLRNPHNFQFQSKNLKVVKGDARDYDSVYSLVKECQAVISTIGQPTGEMPIFSQATQNVIMAMKENFVRRYVLTTGLNVDTPFDKKSPKTQIATKWMRDNYPETTLDKQEEYRVLSESKIDWTLVRLPIIQQTDERGKIAISLKDCPGEKISATDLAYFLIGQIFGDEFIKKAPFIANV